MMYPRRSSGYYIDVGASGLIASGEIRLESGRGVSHLTEDAVVLDNGTVLPADLVVSATGYGPMTDWAARLISPEVAARVGPCRGIGSDTARDTGPWHGELRNMWTPITQAGLWFHGGNFQQSRHFSRYLALQLKARYEGLPVAVHTAPVPALQAYRHTFERTRSKVQGKPERALAPMRRMPSHRRVDATARGYDPRGDAGRRRGR